MYYRYKDLHQAVKRTENKKVLWASKEAKDRGVDFHDANHEKEIKTRAQVRLDLCMMEVTSSEAEGDLFSSDEEEHHAVVVCASCLQAAVARILTRGRIVKGGSDFSLLLGCDFPLSGLNARAFEDDIISDSVELSGFVQVGNVR